LRERWLFGEAAEAWVFEKAITFLHEPLWASLIGDARERGSSVTPERRRRLLDVLDRTWGRCGATITTRGLGTPLW